MKKLFIMAAAIAVSLSSCSKNEVHQNESAENAVSFSTYTGISTKGVEMDNTELLKGFGVLAYDHGSLGSFSDSSVPNFMYNTEVTGTSDQSATTWSYSPLKYWSSDNYNYYSFFAYAPYNGDVTATNGGSITLSGADAKGAPTATLTIATDAEEMVDFVAGQEINSLNDRKKVELNMKHQLTRVAFSAKATITSTDTDNPHYVNVKSIRLLGTTPKSPIDIKTVTKVDADTEGAVKIGNDYYIVTTISKDTPYNKIFGSDDLYAYATYKFNTTTTTDGEKTAHGQDGQWSAVSALSTDLDASGLLNTTDGFASDDDVDYATTGVLVQSNQTAVDLFTDGEYLFLIPPVVMTGDQSDVYNTGIIADESGTENLNNVKVLNNIQVEVIYDIITVDDQLATGYVASSTNSIAIVEIPTGTLKQGYAYNFVLTINGKSYTDPTDDTDPEVEEDALQPVEISGTVIDWDAATGYTGEITVQQQSPTE